METKRRRYDAEEKHSCASAFLEGIGSVMNIPGNFWDIEYRSNNHYSIKNHFDNVGMHFRNAIEKLSDPK